MLRLVAHGSARLVAVAAMMWMSLAASAFATEIERVVSPGGIEAWLVSESMVPLIQVNFAFEGGTAQDPEGKPGVASMLSTLLDEGAGELDAEAFQRRLAELAVSLSFDAGRDAFYGQMRTLTDNRAEAFDLLRMALTEPRFDDEAVERMRTQIEARLRRNLQDPQSIASRVWSEHVFGSHPYGAPSDGTLDTVAAIGVDDLRAYLDANLARDNLVVAVVGDIDASTLGPLLDQVFGDLPEASDLRDVPAAELPREDLREVVEMSIPQTVIRFGSPGLMRDDPDFIPAYVVNHILGGGSFTSRLYREVRERRGLAYSVFTYLYPLEQAGLFVGGVATRNDRAEESMSIIRHEIERMAREGPSEAELASAQRYLVGNYPLRFDSSSKIARQLVEIQLDELGIDYINERNGLIEAVTGEDVRRAARRLLGDGGFYVTMVGQPDAMAEDADGG